MFENGGGQSFPFGERFARHAGGYTHLNAVKARFFEDVSVGLAVLESWKFKKISPVSSLSSPPHSSRLNTSEPDSKLCSSIHS